MKSTLVLFFTLFTTVSFCQTDLHAELKTLESEIKSLDKEISSLESQRDQELNAQQLIIDEKQKEENTQQQIVDQINDEIKDLNTKLSNYGVSKDNLDIYNFTDRYQNLSIWRNPSHVAINTESLIYSEDIASMIISELEK